MAVWLVGFIRDGGREKRDRRKTAYHVSRPLG